MSHEQVRDDDPRPYRANFSLNIGLEPVIREYDMQRQNTMFTYSMTQPQGWLDPKVVLAYSRTQLETAVFRTSA